MVGSRDGRMRLSVRRVGRRMRQDGGGEHAGQTQATTPTAAATATPAAVGSPGENGGFGCWGRSSSAIFGRIEGGVDFFGTGCMAVSAGK